MGLWALETEGSESETCSWQAAWDHSDVYPGEIVEVADPDYAGVEMGGRIAGLIDDGAGVEGIELDREITLEPVRLTPSISRLPTGRWRPIGHHAASSHRRVAFRRRVDASADRQRDLGHHRV
jgi:predicted phage tail protein